MPQYQDRPKQQQSAASPPSACRNRWYNPYFQPTGTPDNSGFGRRAPYPGQRQKKEIARVIGVIPKNVAPIKILSGTSHGDLAREWTGTEKNTYGREMLDIAEKYVRRYCSEQKVTER
jgi:hypothetical protein